MVALNQKVAGIVGMTFLDQRSLRVRVESAFDSVSGLVGAPLMKLLARIPERGLPVSVRWVSKMRALVNGPAANLVTYADIRPCSSTAIGPLGPGGWHKPHRRTSRKPVGGIGVDPGHVRGPDARTRTRRTYADPTSAGTTCRSRSSTPTRTTSR
ncbi:hypothetical protein [Kribbella sp. NPDC004536]|uniref:hypothetical protein n=1 Tax=Kribbella sp. NPDC004536 TaxID=3364106 RepID=UPI0036CAF0D1